MKTMNRLVMFAAMAGLTAASCIAQTAVAPAPAPQMAAPIAAGQGQAQVQSACGNQPLCTDTPDFTATVTDFRLTQTNGIKVMDVTVRFQNKTQDTLILGYENGSEMAMDEQGNRYAPNPWGNSFRGIGAVNGNNMDPKFAIRAGSWGDASFELVWRPGAQDPIGSTFEYALSVREINTLAGNQHSLGGEFPIHFQGLANGVHGVSPGYSPGSPNVIGAAGGSPMLASGSGLPPCGAAGTLAAVGGAAGATGNQTANNAASQATGAAATLSSLGALFKKKQANANQVSTTAGGQPCAGGSQVAGPVPVTTAGAAPVTATPTTAATGTAKPNAAAPVTANGAKVVSASQNRAAIPAATNVKTATTPAAAQPVTTTAKAPATTLAQPAAAKPAAKTVAAAPTPAAAKKPAPAKPDPKKPAQP